MRPRSAGTTTEGSGSDARRDMTKATGTARQRSIRAAMKRLGAARIEAFLRAAFDDGAHCVALKLIIQELDGGARLEDVLLDGDQFGYSLSVRALTSGRFEIDFGCHPGEMVGDGGTWVVEVDEVGKVLRLEGGMIWIS